MKRFAFASMLLVTSALFAVDTQPAASSLPPIEAGAKERLEKSPRHGEWVEVEVPGSKVPLKTWVVYPERKDKAPVVIVIMEIFGESDWIRATTDQLAADGFIAVAPDFLSGKGPNGGGSEAFAGRDGITRAVSGLASDEVVKNIDAARSWALKQPAASGKSATMGFCWGGSQSFNYAVQGIDPKINAAVVFYGAPPKDDLLAKVACPVAGFYGGDDARITSTTLPTDEKMKKLGKSYDAHIFEGAGHGFMRQQDGKAGKNLEAAQKAWPLALAFLRKNLE